MTLFLLSTEINETKWWYNQPPGGFHREDRMHGLWFQRQEVVRQAQGVKRNFQAEKTASSKIMKPEGTTILENYLAGIFCIS